MYYGLGQTTRTPFMTCPNCSYLVDGTCVICGANDPHPACENCVAGHYQPPPEPWYKHDIFLAVTTATIASVMSAIAISQISGLMPGRRKRRG